MITTNHPEKLDTALIRPGRVGKRVNLISAMITKYPNYLEISTHLTNIIFHSGELGSAFE